MPWRNIRRHIACVPKGFLRYHVLRLLKERPMSGSEIMESIERETHGSWKPSPGSIYPLLAWLQDNGYISEVSRGEGGVKRYTITEQGLKFLEEHEKMREKMGKMVFMFGLPPPPWLTPHIERPGDLERSLGRIIGALADLRDALERHLSEQEIKEIMDSLNDTAEKIEALTKKIREKRGQA
ncbi:PadR family transcriptional regulator [Candidatus Bathyarchaeota archaeon]|nr:PadR family transcriptional regulator [Candidatus Bathyarchaeota archaeon]